MDAQSTFCVILGTLLFLNSISCIPVSNEEVRHRFTRQSENVDSEESDNDDSNPVDLADRISAITDSSSTLIADLLAALASSAKIIRDILDAKRKIVEPLLEGTAKALETLSESKAIERTLETVQTVAAAGLQATTGITTALSRVGSSASPRLLQTITGVSEISGRVIRLAICTLICPIQSGDERRTCQKENCGKVDKSDNLDYYDGDYEESSDNI